MFNLPIQKTFQNIFTDQGLIPKIASKLSFNYIYLRKVLIIFIQTNSYK